MCRKDFSTAWKRGAGKQGGEGMRRGAVAEKPEGKGLCFPWDSGLSARCIFVGRADWEGVQKAQAGVRGRGGA